MKKSILIGLNELNFEFIKRYVEMGHLPTFKRLFDQNGYVRTESEKEYRLLEPWIQWVSIHTGKTYQEHKVFRLGDIEERNDLKQLWELAEDLGLSVGAISPFNAKNNLLNADFFIPDPWTNTKVSGNFLLKNISKAVSYLVNNNSNNKINKSSLFYLLIGFMIYVPPSRYFHYFKLLFNLKLTSTKPVILDSILSDLFISLWKRNKPDFSSIFLNSGAHIQHHYLFNSKAYIGEMKNPEWYCSSKEDPLLQILIVYDNTLSRIINLGTRIFIATGLHQQPHSSITYYWRLKDHKNFLSLISINNYINILPRMSRDFLIECSNSAEALEIEERLKLIKLNNINIFEIDNRGSSLFVELIYSNEIFSKSFISIDGVASDIDLYNYVSFVAIKNGEHNGVGYFMDSNKKYNPKDSIQLTSLFGIIKNSFINN